MSCNYLAEELASLVCLFDNRDLKPENILLSEDMHIQITDFGTAKQLTDSKQCKWERREQPGLQQHFSATSLLF